MRGVRLRQREGLGCEGMRGLRPAGLVPGSAPLLHEEGKERGPACANAAPSHFRHCAVGPADPYGQDTDPLSATSSQKPCF